MFCKVNDPVGYRLNDPKVIIALKAKGFELNFRIDQFSDRINSDYIFFGFNSTLLKENTLEALEKKIQSEMTGDQSEMALEYPVFVGIVPYEQASEFLKLKNRTLPGVSCFMSNILVAVHKTNSEILFIKHNNDLVSNPSDFENKTVQVMMNCLKEAHIHIENSEEPSTDIRPDQETQVKIDYHDYRHRIHQALDEIREGEIFQVVLSEKMELPYQKGAYNYYLKANEIHKAYYSCYLNLESEISVTSPEMLVQYDANYVRTKPIAGTRAIKKDGRDAQRIETLLKDQKEGAEHLMLVDLGRNDLSKVCKPGTIQVERYKQPLILEHVVHLISEVRGERAFNRIFDPIRATFPAGTVSGAPKIRAMDIISALESKQRGLYAGSVFEITSKQNFESCIAIRCAMFGKGTVTIQVGSGIVYDSNPEDEFKEIINKARGNIKTYEALEAKNVSINR